MLNIIHLSHCGQYRTKSAKTLSKSSLTQAHMYPLPSAIIIVITTLDKIIDNNTQYIVDKKLFL